MKTFILMIAGIFTAFALNAQDQAIPTRPFHISMEEGAGNGSKVLYVGIQTNHGDNVSISEGGGMLVRICAGYTFMDRYDLSMNYGIQTSEITPQISNGSGFLDHTMFDLVGRYIYEFGKTKRSAAQFGIGYVHFTRTTLDLDFSQIAGRYHEIYQYKPAPGMKMLAEYDGYTRRKVWSFGLGYEYIVGNTHLSSASLNGVDTDLNNFASDDLKYIHLNTGNFYGKITWHIGSKAPVEPAK